MSKQAILVVDDDPDICELIEDALGDRYRVHTSFDVAEAQQRFNETAPEIVLLDVHLPSGNGLDLCAEFVGVEGKAPLVLLTSGQSTPETQLEAFNRGGSDFLPKPFKLQELCAKIDRLAEFRGRESALKHSSNEATEVAMAAMTEAAHYGEVVRFYNAMYQAKSLESIAEELFKLMHSFGLQSSLQLRADRTLMRSCKGECGEVEQQIFETFSHADRLMAFSKRLLVNGRYASLLIKNMPLDNEKEEGRLRDILTTLVDGVDAKLLDFQRLGLLRQTATELSESSGRLGDVVRTHEAHLTGAMDHIIGEISASFDHLQLNEEQEAFFRTLAERVLRSMEESFERVGQEIQILDCLRMSLTAVLERR